jgi:hypothetical protein
MPLPKHQLDKLPPDKQIQALLTELRIFGFAAAKEIARIKGEQSGTMACPLCGQDLRFSTAVSNNHFRARCSRKGCMNILE